MFIRVFDLSPDVRSKTSSLMTFSSRELTLSMRKICYIMASESLVNLILSRV